ncbi:MAG: SRPBCC family protein, partial [Candidatus Promineifilaceae bacterium]
SLEDVFALWADVENYPYWMHDIKSVENMGGHTSYWVMREGPNNTILAWDVKTTLFEKNKRLAWRSIGGDIETSGQVTFTPLSHGEVEITYTLHHAPQVNLDPTVAEELFSDPGERMQRDLRNFKAHLEGMEERMTP